MGKIIVGAWKQRNNITEEKHFHTHTDRINEQATQLKCDVKGEDAAVPEDCSGMTSIAPSRPFKRTPATDLFEAITKHSVC